MKAIAVLVALSLMLGVLFSGAADEAKPPFKHKVAADFKTCPEGHAALKNIPILCGRYGVHYKKPADYDDEDRKMAERVAKGEVILGGDFVLPDAPDSEAVCQTCGFAYHILLPDDPEGDGWHKSNGRPDSFKKPLSNTLLGFPQMGPVKDSVSYTQLLDAAGKAVDWEDVMFRTSFKIDDVLKTVKNWMSQHSRDPAKLTRNTDAGAYHSYSYQDNYVNLSINDDTYWNPGQISIILSLRVPEADKPVRLPMHIELLHDTEAPRTDDPFTSPIVKPAAESGASKP